MAVNIGTVFMDLRAASTNLKKDIDKAMGRTGKQLKQAGKDISRLMTASLAVASASIVAATQKGLTAVDNLAKTSDRLGIATESLQAFRHAADLSGSSAEVLDMGLQRMTRRIAEAAQGTGEARNAIRELGLEASRLNTLGTEEQFLAIADAMKEVENASDRVRLTQKLFDSEGVRLLNTLEMGREGLEASRKELDQLGVSISRIDAIKVERANDAMTKLGQAFKGISNRLAVELAPLIELASNRLLDMAKSGDLVGEAVKSSMNFIAGIGAGIQNAFHAIQIGANAVGAAISAVGFTFASVIEGARKLLNGFQGVAKVAFENFDTFARVAFNGAKVYLIDFVQEATTRLRQFQETFASLGKALSVVPGLQGVSGMFTAFNASADEFSGRLQDSRAAAQREISGLVGDVEGAAAKIDEAWSRAMSDQTEGSIAMVRDTFGEMFKEVTAKLENLSEKGFPGLKLIESIQGLQGDVDSAITDLEKRIKDRSLEIPPIEIPLQYSLDESIKDIQDAPTQALSAFRRQFEVLSIQLKENVIGLDEFTAGVDRMKAMVGEAQQVFNATRTNAEMYQTEIDRLIRLNESGVITQDTFNRAIANTAREFDLTEKPVRSITIATDRYTATVAKLREQLKSGAIDQEEFRKSLENIGEDYQKEIDKINSQIQTVQEQWYAVNRNIESSIDDLVENGKFSFKGLVDSIIKDLAKIQLRKMLIGDGLGMGGGGGLLGGIFKAIKSILPGFASGGRPNVGEPIIVGEKGPEIMVPDFKGTIFSHDQSKRFMAKMESPAVQMPASSSARQTKVIEKAVSEQKLTQVHLHQTNNIESGVQAPQVAEMLNEHGKELITNFIDLVQRGGTVTQVFQS